MPQISNPSSDLTQVSSSGLTGRTHVFFVTCSHGFESALYEELNEIYFSYDITCEVETGFSGCYVTGPFECAIVANLTSFCASRVLYVCLECDVETEQEIYDSVCEINWPDFFDVNKTFMVKSNVANSILQNSMYLSLKVKDAVCDTFVEKIQSRPNVDQKNPDVKIHVRLVNNKLSVSLDTSGQALFMRGYKLNSVEAPLKETLAACLLRLSGWNKLVHSMNSSSKPVYYERVPSSKNEGSENIAPTKIPRQVLLSPFLVDQFCGSGTILIEAALALLNMNPNSNREHFSFLNLFPNENQAIQKLFETFKSLVVQKRKSVEEVKKLIVDYARENKIEFQGQDNFFPIKGSDIDGNVVAIAKGFAQKAGVENLVEFSVQSAEDVLPHASCGIILINPPYGERIGSKLDLPLLYKTTGNSWKKNFSHWTAWLLSSNESLTKSVGLRATRKFSVYNGNLECRFLQYVMYPFTRD